MIVVAVIAVIAAVAVPRLLRSRISANETSAVASLKTIASAQQNFRSADTVDLDKNGSGEFGYLEELAGTKACRSDNAGTCDGPLCKDAPFIVKTLGSTNANGESAKAGYRFLIHLPTGPAGGHHLYPQPVNIALSADSFHAYAFPATAGRSGRRVFGLAAGTGIFQFGNAGGAYGGTGNGPDWDALLGDNDGNAGITWHDSVDLGGPGQTGSAGAWTAIGN